MRMSIRRDDPGYSHRAYTAKPYLNGVLLDNCITADEERGEVLCYARDANGDFYLNDAKDEVVTETLYGHVRIELE